MKNLTREFVASELKPGRYFDGGSGLHLLIRSGVRGPRKYWMFRFTHQGKRMEKSLGIFPSVSLSHARKASIAMILPGFDRHATKRLVLPQMLPG